MKRGSLHTAAFMSLIAAVFMILPFSAEAADKKINIDGKIYEFDEKSEYEISSSEPINGSSFGKFSISGSISGSSEINGVPAFEAADGSAVSFAYEYDDGLLNAADDKWHLTEDSCKFVNGIAMEEKIKNGAVILQTSLDQKSWTTVYKQTNAFEDTPVQTEAFYETNEIQLINGCYYRFIAAYKTEIETNPKKLLFINTADKEYKKHAEVYEFYVKYDNTADPGLPSNERRFSLGEVTNTGKNNGYSGSNPLTEKDPHYGWTLGSFFVSGYTERTDDNSTFFKNPGDKVTLWFRLDQNIDCLNGNDKLLIADDNGGSDQYFQTAATDMGRGTLIIRYTDHEGVKHDPVIYTNYLEALTSAGADTKVQLFEEGDYEVALDYKIRKDEVIDSYEDYRIFFTFKIRNGNCMVYPFDISTKKELANSSVCEDGFYLDLARSRYLKINVEMARWTKGIDGYTKDTRFNRPAKDGDKYTDEGIYTIKVSNPSTGEKTEKQIYVGNDSVLIAFMNPDNSEYSIDEIAALVDLGAEITEDGTIIPPKPPETEPPETTTASETTTTTVTTTAASTTAVTTTPAETSVTEDTEAVPVSAEVEENKSSSISIIVCVVVAAAAAVGIWLNLRKNKKE